MGGSRVNEEEEITNDLIFRLQALLAETSNPRFTRRAKLSKVLTKTIKYIKKLQREVDEQSERLSQLLQASIDTTHGRTDDEEDILMSLLLQLQRL